jgi:hypothetical protein
MVTNTNKELLVRCYPRLYHMSHAGSWPGILQKGLLSTTALLDLFEVTGARRDELESCRRAKSEEITHPLHGRAMLRDQQPMNEAKLKKALTGGLTPRDWYRFLNRKVFFWGPKSRLKILQGARLYEAHPQTIIEIDTARFLERYADRVSLCHINSGSTQPMAWERSTDTFIPLEAYPLAERRKRYGVKGAVAEVTVEYALTDMRDFVVTAYEAAAGGAINQVFFPTQDAK